MVLKKDSYFGYILLSNINVVWMILNYAGFQKLQAYIHVT